MMAEWDPRTTYRIRQLPFHLVDRSQAVALLIRLEESLGPTDNIHMFPLASSANIWEKQPTKMTTVMFKKLPRILDNDKSAWVLRARDAGYPDNIIIDVHFLDFTSFNDVHQENHTLDCIAISGLSSHAFGSWRSRGDDPNFMWLRDRLPRDIPGLRSIIYGYDTKLLLSSSNQTIDDISRLLITKLKSIGRSSLSARPLIFLAHSLGGIILKKALVFLANSGDRERYILDLVKAVVLFGVPSRGMHISHLLPMVEGQPNEALIRLLGPGSNYLADLEEQFNGIACLQRIRVISAYETGLSKTNKKSETGKWAKTGPEELLVNRESAIARQSSEADRLPIDRDHSNMVKFEEDDLNYRAVLLHLHDISRSFEPKRPERKSSLKADVISKRLPRSSRRVSNLVETLRRIRTRKRPLQVSNAASNVAATSECRDSTLQTEAITHQNARSGDWAINESKESDGHLQSEMMDSLSFGMMNTRLNEIDKVFKNTFEWVFEGKDIDFTNWLHYGSGIYWISGKPGSGKSTLMKFIWQHDRTKQVLNERSSKETQISISFFFHNRGSHLQKSFEGLYRSIIDQILVKAPFLQKIALAIFQKQQVSQSNPWSLEALERLFESILEQNLQPISIMLFLDALDEYDGPPEIIADFVKCAAERPKDSATKVQICFSSRPWNYFMDQFENSPGFKIHEHTQHDIREYVIRRLKLWPATCRLVNLDEDVPSGRQSPRVVEQIIDRAQGVFLWLRLTMDQVLKESTKGNSTEEQLMEIVRSLPDKLDDLYLWTIKRTSDHHNTRMESYIMFEIVHRAFGPLSLGDFAVALSCATCKTVHESRKRIPSDPEDSILQDQILRRLRDRSGGLLEVMSEGDKKYVQFMHQTVKDFVSKPGFQEDVLDLGSSLLAENGYTFLSKSILALMSMSFLEQSDSFGKSRHSMLYECLRYSSMSELTTGRSQREYLESIDNEALRTAYDGWFKVERTYENLDPVSYPRPINSVLTFAAIADLRLYVNDVLSETPILNLQPHKSLLHCIVEGSFGAKDVLKYVKLKISFDLSHMAEVLLSHNADMEARYMDLTPFELLLNRGASLDKDCKDLPEILRKSLVEDIETETENLATVFLSHGQNPNIPISIWLSRDQSHPFVCKPIHICPARWIKALLDYGADVNALDQDGRTALDISYLALSNPAIQPDQNDRLHIVVRGTYIAWRVRVLLRNQGCVTNIVYTLGPDGKSIVDKALENWPSLFGSVDPHVRSPQRLVKPQSSLTWRLSAPFRALLWSNE